MGDEPSRTPQYYTQTITQLDWSFSTAPEEDKNEEEPLLEGQEESQEDIYNIPSSSQSFRLPSNPTRPKPLLKSPRRSPLKSSMTTNTVMGTPQTPCRTSAREIPSSQSPASPSSFHYRAP